jgi:hypothetical protein
VLIRSLELVERPLQDVINVVGGIEQQVVDLREDQDLDGSSHAHLTQPRNESADELLARHRSLTDADHSDQAVPLHQDLHPCRGGLKLIKGEDGGGIDRCLKNDLKHAELERLVRGGKRGAYLFWKCDSCKFRIKYFVSKSAAASLLTNDDHPSLKDSKVRCSRAFLAMSHMEQQDTKRTSNSHGPPKYTCIICALHPPAAKAGSNHTFCNRDDYAKHVENAHINGTLPPPFVLNKLGIEHGEGWSTGRRKELWIG